MPAVGGQVVVEAGSEDLNTIREMTREFDVSSRTLRFYEDEGLIFPLRRGRTRLYRQTDRIRLRLVLRGKRLGLSLAEIREIIDMYSNEPGEAGQLRHLLERIKDRRAELMQKLADIRDTLSELDTVETGCLERLSEMGEGP